MNLNRTHSLDAQSIAGALSKAKRSGPNQYTACCPAHDDNSPSLSIKDSPDGKVLVHCHAGCTQDEVINALRDMGLWHQPSAHRIKQIKRQSAEGDIKRCEILLALATSEHKQGIVHSEWERAQIKRAIRFLEGHS